MNTAILHYSVPPVVGGVEAVIHAHAVLLLKAGYPVTLITGAGDTAALPDGAEFFQIPEMDSRNPRSTGDVQYYHSLLDLRQRLYFEQEARFVSELGFQPEVGYTIGLPLVREFYRARDVLFMPSYREGFVNHP
jgi:hypothetical protein